VVDFPADHPSCSKQHAVIQYRLVDYTKEDGPLSALLEAAPSIGGRRLYEGSHWLWRRLLIILKFNY
uniref:FHA domain-containing protein n=1 Tax=Amphimedon queenslandica TaxID=400682 RepID=A0A1X7SL89_AMPQE